MDASIPLAQFWGWFLLIESSLYVVRGTLLAERLGDKAFIALDGYLSFTLGLVTVILHNLWVADWRVAVTVLGWFFLFRGIARIGFPEVIAARTTALTDSPVALKAILSGLIVVSGWLLWMSWPGR
jgi:hypothetical protein